ncbi:methionine--tRNA ligase [Candidatus Kaiserbacteria bacterium RIFCSPHIGHO2_02_FULL_49_34]|uniref:Methionine--tRNA ligase n=1 Tax=Candidatus Kaiserbacteria bacterium RIFCSPHIGHO2_02_FULL_49_34 TaxID=1798491 RepID=A0A1F6DI82_9BACT|nr:MAG: methionine--tRNA ligase [Candidatus Kaiserbacteria bacterium RIFCSPHIGHO2_02_FULL_49_34]
MKNIYITTTLPYVNADPHIGFGLEAIRADALARAYRLSGDDVFFTTGTDEHGQKIAEKADSEGKGRQEYVDHFAGQFAKLRDALDLSYDNFIRTTSPNHKVAAQEMWRRCAASGDIYKKKYTGLYCVGDEMFLKDNDLVNGRCPNHPNMVPQEVEEENYFFALSKYQSYLEEYLSKPGVIEPEFRRLEALNFVKAGLEDFSISREVSRMDWGIPVPGDDSQVMYVWFDALTNYISTLGWPEEEGNFKKFWVDGDTLQLAGKDQVRFQSIMWQAMLKSAGLPATKRVDYHGFINSGGQKMSKSLGNVIAPFDLVEKYGTDATRYMLLRHVHPYDDTDITWERMDEWYTANLVNGLGNLASRIMKMAETHGVAPELPEVVLTHEALLDLEKVWQQIGALDEKIATEEPFKVIKVDAEKGKAIIAELVVALHEVASLLQAAMPQTSAVILDAIKANEKPENLFPRLP